MLKMYSITRLLVLMIILHGLFRVSNAMPGTCTRCAQSQKCNPPDCFCCREELDMPFSYSQLPQIVFFTFDDAVTAQVGRFYKKLFDSSRKNPNGCAISMTLFVSHANTKYDLVREFYERGMEIASHSVTHSAMNTTNFYTEAKTQKENLAKLAKIPIEDIKGWRSPFLKPAGDLQPDTLHKLGYLYDATLTFSKRSYREKPPSPFTLDFGWPYECQVKPCPRNRHPGFWEVPVVSLMDYKKQYDCVYVDGCLNAPPDEDAAYKFLWDNFYNYHSSSKMPFGINMHPSWFYYPDRLKAMDRFVRELVKMDDVYIVSVGKMIEWLKDPTPLSELKLNRFKPWSCDREQRGKGSVRRINTVKTYIRPSPPPPWIPGQGIQSVNNRRRFLQDNLAPTPPPPIVNRRTELTAQERHIQLMIQNRQLQKDKAANSINRNTNNDFVGARRRIPLQPVQTLWHLRMTPRRRHVFQNRYVQPTDNRIPWRSKGQPYHHGQPNINIWAPLKPTPTAIIAHTESPKSHGINHHFDDFLHRIQEPALTGRITLNPTPNPTSFKYTATPASNWITHIKPRPELRTQAPKPSRRSKADGHVTPQSPLVLTTEHPLLKRRRIQLEHMRRKNETITRQRELEKTIRQKQIADIREQQRALKLKMQNLERRRNQRRQLILKSQPRQATFRSGPIVVHQPSPRQRQAWQSFIQMMLRSPQK